MSIAYLQTTDSITATSFVKVGGNSTQFLKADGSVDATVYQAAYTNLTTFGSLANAVGFLKNNGSGVLSYDNTPQNTALWGSITGASAQAAPAGGWTGNHGAMSMGALTASSVALGNGQMTAGSIRISGSTNPYIGVNDGVRQGYLEIDAATQKLSLTYQSVIALGFDTSRNATFASSVSMGALGTNGKTPQTSASVNAACTDLATAIALVNQLRAALVANGICV
jgi:hypothetical protein